MSRRLFVAGIVLVCGLTAVGAMSPGASLTTGGVSVTTYVGGLNDPRGLTFGADGRLYIAEAGSGGDGLSTQGICDQVAPPVGPFVGGFTARVLSVGLLGQVSVVVDGMPSAEASPAIGGDKQGVSAVASVGQRLYALISGAGCSHAHADDSNGIIDVTGGDVAEVANLSEWLLANPGAKGAENPRNPDYEPDGVWYSMLFHRSRLYVLEPNHSLLVSVHPQTGDVRLEEDLFDRVGDHTFTSMAVDRDDIYLGTLGQIAFVPGIFPPVPDLDASFEAGVYRLTPTGAITQVAGGLKAVLGVAFDQWHRMYVLQSPIFIPGTGSLVRIAPDGTVEPVLEGLVFPSSLVRGPDGAFYLTQCGYHCAPGAGEVLRVTVE